MSYLISQLENPISGALFSPPTLKSSKKDQHVLREVSNVPSPASGLTDRKQKQTMAKAAGLRIHCKALNSADKAYLFRL